MLVNKNKKQSHAGTATATLTKPISADKMLTMQEAMDYLSDKGVPCKSRATFYRIIEDFEVPYVNTNPKGRHEVRRFSQEALNKVLEAKGLQQ